MTIKVVNRYHGVERGKVTVYIGHVDGYWSRLANPFRGKLGHQPSVDAHAEHLAKCMKDKSSPEYKAIVLLCWIARKYDVNLECSCAPRTCHGDNVKREMLNYMKRMGWVIHDSRPKKSLFS